MILIFVLLEILIQFEARKFGIGSANQGFSFGLGQNSIPSILYLLFAIGLFGIIYFKKIKSRGWLLIAAGGLANGIARVAFGSVWDYLHWSYIFPIWFNLADVSITLGLVLALCSI